MLPFFKKLLIDLAIKYVVIQSKPVNINKEYPGKPSIRNKNDRGIKLKEV